MATHDWNAMGFGGMGVAELWTVKQREDEVRRLKQLVADPRTRGR